jgi:glycosyltransferase involved in cell wall biosynthesis
MAAAYDVDFYFTSPDAAYWYQPSRFDLDLSELKIRYARNPSRLYRSIVAGEYDAVVSTLSGRASLVAAYGAARRADIPFLLWIGIWEHPRTLFHRLSRPFTRLLYRHADALFVYGSHVAEHVRREVGRERSVFELCQAVDNEVFRRHPPRVAPGNRSDTDGSSVLGCFVGRLDPDKGVDLLLTALAAAPRVRLLVIGEGTDEATGALVRLAARLQISERVEFVGFLPQADLPSRLADCNFLVLPSVTTRKQKEPWGLVVNEAMNCGLPVIATTAVGAAAGGLVVDEITGFVVPERDTAALAAAMNRIAGDVDLRARLGAAARDHVQRWSYDVAAAEFSRGIEAALSPLIRPSQVPT